MTRRTFAHGVLATAVVLAASCAVVCGVGEGVLHAAPALVLGLVLLTGRYPGEARIVARRAGCGLKPALARRFPADRPRAFVPVHARAARTLRGPPVHV